MKKMNSSKNIDVFLIKEFQDFAKLKDEWNLLLAQSDSNNPFLTFEWQINWWKCFGNKHQLYLIRFTENKSNKVVGIAPLMIRKKGGFRVVQFIGTGISDSLDFIILNEYHNEVFASLFQFVRNNSEFDLMLLNDIPLNNSKYQSLSTIAGNYGFKTCYRLYHSSPYLTIDKSWQNYLKSRSRNFRRTLKRRKNKIRKENKKLELVNIKNKEFNIKHFETIIEIKKNSWKNKNGTAKIKDDLNRRFYWNFICDFNKNNWADIWIGFLDNAAVAYLINFQYANKIWGYDIAYDNRYANYSPGAILAAEAVRDAHDQKRLEFDFLRGDESYKSHWTESVRDSYQVVIFKESSLRSFISYFTFYYLRLISAKSLLLKKIQLTLIIMMNKLKINNT